MPLFLLPHAYQRLWPFFSAEHVGECAEQLRQRLATVPAFTLHFDKFSYFKQKQACTVHLKPRSEPEDALHKLQEIMVSVFPECDDLSKRSDEGFTPHLTVGQWPSEKKTEEAIRQLMTTWKPFELRVSKVCFLYFQG